MKNNIFCPIYMFEATEVERGFSLVSRERSQVEMGGIERRLLM